jgi:hypothetical protein
MAMNVAAQLDEARGDAAGAVQEFHGERVRCPGRSPVEGRRDGKTAIAGTLASPLGRR